MDNTAKIYLTIFTIAILASVVLGYTYYRTTDLLLGPQIIIETPANGTTIEESLVHIRGTTKNITNITLNGRNIFVDESGTIKESLLLTYGYNVLELSAKDRFGRETKETLELIYK